MKLLRKPVLSARVRGGQIRIESSSPGAGGGVCGGGYS